MVSGASPMAILDRLVKPDDGDLPVELAAYLDRLDFDPADHDRVAELASRGQGGVLTDAERQEYETYILLDDLLAILRSKARRSLRRVATNAGEPGRKRG